MERSTQAGVYLAILRMPSDLIISLIALQDEENIEALRLSCNQLMGHLGEALRELSASRLSEEKRRQEFVDFKTALISAVINKEAPRYETGEVRFKRLRRTLLDLLAGC
jgi:hypothetical protein